jgi:hypothetical protein
MTEAQSEKLISSLESGNPGIETFLALSADDRAVITAMLEERVVTNELRQILEQCDGHLTKTAERNKQPSLQLFLHKAGESALKICLHIPSKVATRNGSKLRSENSVQISVCVSC